LAVNFYSIEQAGRCRRNEFVDNASAYCNSAARHADCKGVKSGRDGGTDEEDKEDSIQGRTGEEGESKGGNENGVNCVAETLGESQRVFCGFLAGNRFFGGRQMKKTTPSETKAPAPRKANVKSTVKKTASTTLPRIALNHNETFLTL
jgi:hypothetical protein